MIKKVLTHSDNKKIFWLTIIGAIIGLSLLLVAVQTYVDINFALKTTNDNQFVVIKKEITSLNTFGLTASTFSEEEINQLKEQPFVSDLATFKTSNQIEVLVVMRLGGGNYPPFTTLAFFESIPNRFIDVETKEWNWKENQQEVPIILPNTFLDAYNYGIAPSMGAPQASKDLISNVKFELRIKGIKGEATYYGKVVAFSDRINSILVPEDFLNYLNANYGTAQAQLASRIIFATPNKTDAKLKAYLANHHYETNKEQFKESVIQQISNGLFLFLVSIATIIIIMSALLFILYNQITVAKSEREIKTLLLLGYTWQQITQTIVISMIKTYIFIAIASFIILIVVKLFLTNWLYNKAGLTLPSSIALITFIVGLAFILLFLFLNKINLKKLIIKLAQPK